MQQAFLEQDAYQCGYCTPGQICSAVGMLDEADSGLAEPRHPTDGLETAGGHAGRGARYGSGCRATCVAAAPTQHRPGRAESVPRR